MTTQSPTVHGTGLTPLTQCTHWNSPLDIIAIKHKCCNQFYACISCHAELAKHPAEVWLKSERGEKAVLCGSCKHVLSIDEYLNCGNVCMGCGKDFNPGCRNHHGLYFEVE
ncbi:zinc finger CHY domain-containing protein [Calycina marina]|uniref:Zinc finger CHY domain-containing protein n=1 Tax=Calycina marina TaxID=1763456 RepID=A0A9P7Z0E8_9HELO|nr:zinc finger CHY domain-containing protein [Calycina marina]